MTSHPRPMPAHVRTITFGLLATATVAAAVMILRPAPPVAPAVAANAVVAPLRQEGRSVAITFDDLPALAQGDRSVATYERITDGLLRALAEHRVPAIGFVNEEKLLTEGRVDPRRVATLRRWVDAGLELGNHAYSHPDFHTTPVDAYIADVARGDSVTRLVMQAAGRRPRFFRHPFLHTGRSLDDRRRFEGFLAERGYRVAPVTIDNYDYLFAAAYDLAPDPATHPLAVQMVSAAEANGAGGLREERLGTVGGAVGPHGGAVEGEPVEHARAVHDPHVVGHAAAHVGAAVPRVHRPGGHPAGARPDVGIQPRAHGARIAHARAGLHGIRAACVVPRRAHPLARGDTVAQVVLARPRACVGQVRARRRGGHPQPRARPRRVVQPGRVRHRRSAGHRSARRGVGAAAREAVAHGALEVARPHDRMGRRHVDHRRARP